ncbi:hypothetical protein MLD38_009277 [Melastoma candidum]|uniref:Uncharacterized protein n=1 Tax=Melastoma candidum TaxID=119954 RepID=A0ACB9RYX6_9MYRT|nr:hypothetical protein MLD38_009277 [Melastoma candidum]
MSCNGCRVLRKGCGESCILRPCLGWIDGADAQGHATISVAKFFGRAGLFSFIASVPEPQRPDLFRSLLFEACGRMVSPVHGAVGLLWSGNWRICQEAVETVLRGGTIGVIPELLLGTTFPTISPDESSKADDGSCTFNIRNDNLSVNLCKGNQRWFKSPCCSKRMKPRGVTCPVDLGLSLTTRVSKDDTGSGKKGESRRQGTPSMNSDESVTTMTTRLDGSRTVDDGRLERRLLNFFD